ncbi:MAG: hypothetical protein HRT89_18730 [Lentisphaeria bacterium]|nr:hypothetical protein [Lentisphaeria bacterium]
MKEYRYLFNIRSSSNREDIIANLVCQISKPSFPISGVSLFEINTEDELLLSFENITSFYHSNYVRLSGAPIIIFDNIDLYNKFLSKIQSLSLGSIEPIIKHDDSNRIKISPSLEEFEASIPNRNSTFCHFIASSTEAFEGWKNKMDSSRLKIYSGILILKEELDSLNHRVLQKNERLILISQSLEAIKSEYEKELSWYRKEITNIKTWYESEHGNTPKVITKVFKRLF